MRALNATDSDKYLPHPFINQAGENFSRTAMQEIIQWVLKRKYHRKEGNKFCGGLGLKGQNSRVKSGISNTFGPGRSYNSLHLFN